MNNKKWNNSKVIFFLFRFIRISSWNVCYWSQCKTFICGNLFLLLNYNFPSLFLSYLLIKEWLYYRYKYISLTSIYIRTDRSRNLWNECRLRCSWVGWVSFFAIDTSLKCSFLKKCPCNISQLKETRWQCEFQFFSGSSFK